jgi:hypothetical protein
MSNNKQQTAVEWLAEQILLKHPIITQFLPNWNFDESIIQQAKEMHRQEIVNAVDGYPIANRYLDGSEYYEKTYGGNK